MEPILQNIQEKVIEGEMTEAVALVKEAIQQKLPAEQILNEGLIAAMNEVGRRFENGEFYIPEMLIAARTMQAALAILKPSLAQSGMHATGKVVIGTVQGDLHEIGKNLVATMLEGAGFEIIDLGTDVPPEKFVDAVRDQQADLVGISALLTTTMNSMRRTIEALEKAGLRQKVKIMIGGAPVTEAFSKEIGADGYSPDASRAVALARLLMDS
ncbi:MAG: corrinoid protein [Anaerolineales bacterium]|jgi:5-methyltetrahydrofolate--homocysteine methyltransferase